jgi:hypothetical protein
MMIYVRCIIIQKRTFFRTIRFILIHRLYPWDKIRPRMFAVAAVRDLRRIHHLVVEVTLVRAVFVAIITYHGCCCSLYSTFQTARLLSLGKGESDVMWRFLSHANATV